MTVRSLFRWPRRIAALAIALLPSTAPAQTGLLVVAHGADSGWNAQVEATMAQVHWNAGPTRLAFLMGSSATTQSWEVQVHALMAAGAKSIVVVPLMVSTHGEHVTQIRYYAGEVKELPASLAAMMTGMGHDMHAGHQMTIPMRVTTALDASPELGAILTTRWQALSAADRKRPLMLVAHGPSADSLAPRWVSALHKTTAPLAAAMGSPVHVGLLRDDAEAPVRAAAVQGIRDSITALAAAAHDSVTVLTVLVSTGSINTVVIPNDLAGLPIRYVGASLAPHAELARWIERIAGENLVRTVPR